jgi:hypothetical protein
VEKSESSESSKVLRDNYLVAGGILNFADLISRHRQSSMKGVIAHAQRVARKIYPNVDKKKGTLAVLADTWAKISGRSARVLWFEMKVEMQRHHLLIIPGSIHILEPLPGFEFYDE